MIERRYQTFARRFWAAMIDALVFLPIGFVSDWFFAQGYPGWLNFAYYAVVVSSLFYIYSVLMHGYFGQTIGKMIAKVKIMAVDESKLGFKRAFLRDSIIIALTVVELAFQAPAILRGVNPYETSGGLIYNLLLFGSVIWLLAELVTMLTNDKRRAVHDFIAGSVVVRL